MAVVTLGDLTTRAREIAGQETSAPAGAHVDTAELNRDGNQALAAFHGLMVEVQRHEWALTPMRLYETPTVADQNDYMLPDVTMIVSGVRLASGDDEWRIMPWEHIDRDWLASSSELPYLQGYRYRVVGNKLTLEPKPRSSYTIKVDYVPEFEPLANAGASVVMPYGWSEWVALRMAIRMQSKRNTDTSQLERQFAMKDAEIRKLAGRRGSRGLKINDTRRRRRREWFGAPRLWRDT